MVMVCLQNEKANKKFHGLLKNMICRHSLSFNCSKPAPILKDLHILAVATALQFILV